VLKFKSEKEAVYVDA